MSKSIQSPTYASRWVLSCKNLLYSTTLSKTISCMAQSKPRIKPLRTLLRSPTPSSLSKPMSSQRRLKTIPHLCSRLSNPKSIELRWSSKLSRLSMTVWFKAWNRWLSPLEESKMLRQSQIWSTKGQRKSKVVLICMQASMSCAVSRVTSSLVDKSKELQLQGLWSVNQRSFSLMKPRVPWMRSRNAKFSKLLTTWWLTEHRL